MGWFNQQLVYYMKYIQRILSHSHSCSLQVRDPKNDQTWKLPSLQAGLLPNKTLITLLGINISHPKAHLKMIFLFPRWDMLVPWRVNLYFCPALSTPASAKKTPGIDLEHASSQWHCTPHRCPGGRSGWIKV